MAQISRVESGVLDKAINYLNRMKTPSYKDILNFMKTNWENHIFTKDEKRLLKWVFEPYIKNTEAFAPNNLGPWLYSPASHSSHNIEPGRESVR